MLDHGTLETGAVSANQALLHRMRHSAAHVMAGAVLELFPEAKMGIGPPTQDGFYYDFDVSRPFTPEDLVQIQALMEQSIAAGQPFLREEVSREEAERLFAGQPYKLEIIRGPARRRDAIDLPARRVHGPVPGSPRGRHRRYSGPEAAERCRGPTGGAVSSGPCSSASTGPPSPAVRNLSSTWQGWRKRRSGTTAPWAANWTSIRFTTTLAPA